ncbi:MAG: hypothetical protein AAF988_07440 [Pseudomonadota bacterium]
MTQHTPGPWYNCHNIEISKDDLPICSLPKNDWREANARLIAAAPEMYEALQRLIIAGRGATSISDPAYRYAEKIIAKAEGK